MRAAVFRDKRLIVGDVPDPTPGPGQVLVETLACGICGSDLHMVQHLDQLVDGAQAMGRPFPFDPTRDVVMGHEFCAKVVDAGPGVSEVKDGDIVVSMPGVLTAEGPKGIGYSNDYPGGYGERMLLQSMLCRKIPNGLDPRHAALTEPMAVGVHAVAKSGIEPGEAALVLGCGPVGLAVVAALSLAGIQPIIATDFSPARRRLASGLGAHEAVDPAQEPGIDAWQRVDGTKSLVIFEAVGVPGMIDEAMKAAPQSTRILVVGVCMESDTIWPMLGVTKELNIQFALGYSPEEFDRTLGLIASGEFDVAPLITGEVGIDSVPEAFKTLANPDSHAKILVRPALG